ncbi:MAG: urease accessory protein UreH [Nitrospirae bacterium]|nr:urease accessory protein UreH [Nitrospirota bacterium]
MIETLPFTALFLGFLLGLAHAFDPDHVVAVGTLAADSENLRQSSWLGVCWGLGHTVTLTVVGGMVLILKWTIPVQVAMRLEGLVGMMIVLLGANIVWNVSRGWTVHAHTHSHDGSTHSHLHLHAHQEESHRHHKNWSAKKACGVGMVHGVAGSAALSMTVLSAMPSTGVGLIYILLFGAGSMGGMALMSAAMGVPFVWGSSKWKQWIQPLKAVVGVLAIVFGSYLTYTVLI